MAKIDLTGQRFGRLLVISRDFENRSKHDCYWHCRCDCGNEKSVTTGHLRAGTVTSCGCLRKEQAVARFKQAARDNAKHGETGTDLYYVWHNMLERCKNPNDPRFKWYGGKGVKVCSEWQEYENFAGWARAHGYREQGGTPYREKLSIDRIDSSGDYCPQNCRWVTMRENQIRMLRERWANARKKSGAE